MIKIIAVPTQEINKIVQEKLFDLGYAWGDGQNVVRATVCSYGTSAYINLNDGILSYCSKDWYDRYEKYTEITMYDLFQMDKDPEIEVTVKVNGEISKKPLSVETAKRLGIVE